MNADSQKPDARLDRSRTNDELLARAAEATRRILDQAQADFAELELAGPSQASAAAIHRDVAAAAGALMAELKKSRGAENQPALNRTEP